MVALVGWRGRHPPGVPLSCIRVRTARPYQSRSEQERTEIPAAQCWSGSSYVDLVPVRRIDPRSPVPAYQQLRDALQERIEAGEWTTGPLPSIAYLQQEYGVGRDTVMHAIRLLDEDGLVFTVPRRGTYVRKRSEGS
jgi:GntR family transcriptional regulator